MTIFFTSDNHFFHYNIITYCSRPFSSIEEMNNGLIERWNSVVRPTDIIWCLGDFSLNEKYVPGIVRRLNGEKYLVCGNHDACFAAHKKSEAAKQRYLLYGFAGVYQHVMNFEGRFVLSHLPYAGSGDKSKKEGYSSSRLKDEGKWLLHGHIHSKPENRIRGRMFDVGVDANDYTPISLEEIITLTQGK